MTTEKIFLLGRVPKVRRLQILMITYSSFGVSIVDISSGGSSNIQYGSVAVIQRCNLCEEIKGIVIINHVVLS